MLKKKWIDKACIIAIIIAILVTFLLFRHDKIGIKSAIREPLYASKLFDDSYVHHIDIEVDDIGIILKNGEETYTKASVTIDDERTNNVGFRIKGNNSRRLTKEYDLIRYSFKIEFDHYENNSYYGLDKLSLDASFQDNTYLKTYMTYHMFDHLGVPTPLVSYVWLTINGEEFGLYLAIEEMEEAFLRRHFGNDYGALYKPDYKSLSDDNTDVYLGYIDDDITSYPNIFENAKVKVTENDKKRLIASLKSLNEGDLSKVDIDEVLAYFVVSVLVMNWDSYIGYTGHNYYLYEKDGILSMLPWDYNLAYGTYALGMSDPIKDPNIIINYPIDTPCVGEVMLERPMYHEVMKEYINEYHEQFDTFIKGYFDSGLFDVTYTKVTNMIKEYVEKDPSAFCSYKDHEIALETFKDMIDLRVESIKGQLDGNYPSKLIDFDYFGIDASHIDIAALGDFDDLEKAKERQDILLKNSLPFKIE